MSISYEGFIANPMINGIPVKMVYEGDNYLVFLMGGHSNYVSGRGVVYTKSQYYVFRIDRLLDTEKLVHLFTFDKTR